MSEEPEETMRADEPTVVVRRTRRDLLKTVGVVAGAAAVGKLAGADAASAADGQSLILGQGNGASNETTLTTAGIDAPSGSRAFKVIAPNFDYALSGEAQDYGVVGSGAGGVLGLGTVGGVFSGSSVAINLDPQVDPGAPAGEAFKGDLAVDADGVLWLCVAAGTPGTWIRASHTGVNPLATPRRAYASSLRVNQGEARIVQITGLTPGVPDNAVGILGNLTVFDMIGGGYVTLYPAGSARPDTSSINWNETAPVPGFAIANSFSVGLGTGGAVTVFADATVPAGAPATQVLIDVTAYIL